MKKQKRNKNLIVKRKIIHNKKLVISKENAITLIALIMSIIVLLILAGVSLSALVRR